MTKAFLSGKVPNADQTPSKARSMSKTEFHELTQQDDQQNSKTT